MGSCLHGAGGGHRGHRDGDRDGVRCIILLKRNDDVTFIALYYLRLNATLFHIHIGAFTFPRYLSTCGGDRLENKNRVML